VVGVRVAVRLWLECRSGRSLRRGGVVQSRMGRAGLVCSGLLSVGLGVFGGDVRTSWCGFWLMRSAEGFA